MSKSVNVNETNELELSMSASGVYGYDGESSAPYQYIGNIGSTPMAETFETEGRYITFPYLMPQLIEMSLGELLDAEKACDLLMKYYKAESYDNIKNTTGKKYNSFGSGVYEDAAKKYHEVSRTREKIISEIERRIGDIKD